jgi:hypothetical protein
MSSDGKTPTTNADDVPSGAGTDTGSGDAEQDITSGGAPEETD